MTAPARRLALVALLLAAAPAQARDLAVLLRRTADAAALREAVLQPFTAFSGLAVAVTAWPGGLDALRTALQDGPQDVALASPTELRDGCDAGAFEKLDWTTLGGRDRLAPAAVNDCGVGALQTAMVLAWDRDKYQATPSWADFWDVVKAPGKRGLRQSARGALEIALLADGVAAGDVYRTLRSDAGIERAFRRLDQLRPYIVWWRDEAQAARILASGDVLMTAAPASAILLLNRAESRNFALQWNACLTSVLWWSLVKGSDNPASARSFLAYAADPLLQARLVQAGPYGSLAKGAAQPDSYASALPIDEAFWRDNAALTARFDAWIAR